MGRFYGAHPRTDDEAADRTPRARGGGTARGGTLQLLDDAKSVDWGDTVTDLVDTTEMYLKAIIELEEENVVPLRARISERLGHSGPTVSQTVGRMERDGLVVVTGDRHLELTDAGRHKAITVMRKHRLAERLLSDVIGLEWEYVHDEACRWEHVMSEQVELKLLDMLGHPTESPYGNPIPGLEEIGGEATVDFADGVVNLVQLLEGAEGPVSAAVRRIGEPAQIDPELLGELRRAGVFPGTTGTFTARGDSVAVQIDGFEAGIVLPVESAAHVFVTA